MRYIQDMTDLTVTMTPAMRNWVEGRVAEGRYADAADYLRDLVRREQNTLAERERLKALIDEGLRSGIVDRDPRDIIDEMIASLPRD